MSRGRAKALAAAIAAVAAIICAAAPAIAEPGKGTPRNTGQPSSGAFYVDFTADGDQKGHILSSWDVNEEWLAASYRPENILFGKTGMTLKALRKQTGVASYTSAEFQRSGVYGYGRYEVVMRAAAARGAVATFFVHTGGFAGDPHDEVDFELLGRSTRSIHTNFFASGRDSAQDAELWFDAAEGDHLYSFEWLPGRIVWAVDGVVIREVTEATPGVTIPTSTGRVIASLWVANRQVVEWVGEPDFTEATAEYRCMSHVPAGQTGRQCSDVFKPPSR
jgi:beta-glucanase (GH16 family)